MPEPGAIQTTCLAPGQGPSSVLGLVLITVLQAAGASILVAGAGSVGANPGAESQVEVGPDGFCPFLKSLLEGVLGQLYLGVGAK